VLYLVVVNKKRKEKKRNINNDLANLPSYNTQTTIEGSLKTLLK